MYEYHTYGLRVRSDVALPFDARPGSSAEPDVVVRLGTVPPTLSDATHTRDTPTHSWQARSGAYLLHSRGVARYLVSDGRDVVIEPCGGTDDEIAAVLGGSPFPVLLMQRGIVPLHASAVQIDAGAVLLIGTSGVGKSALAATLVERGHPLLADDATGVVGDAGGRLQALPAAAGLRLWAHTLDRTNWWSRVGTNVRQGKEKYWMRAERHRTTPLPLRATFVLYVHSRPDIAIEPVPPGDAFWMLRFHTHRRQAMWAMGQYPVHFRVISTMARRVPTMRVTRPKHAFLLEELADRIEASVRAARPGREARKGAVARQAPVRAASPHRSGSGAGVAGASGPGIVWLASYPKSGNTWLRAVLTNYLHDDGAAVSINALDGKRQNFRGVFDEYVGAASADMTDEEVTTHLPRFRTFLAARLSESGGRSDRPPFMKTHEVYRVPGGAPRFPHAGTAGVVYLVRNPLDVAVSFAHHALLSIDRIIRVMADPTAADSRIPGGIAQRLPEAMTTWSGHVSSWMEQTALRIHVVRYEDLLQDPRTAFGSIIRFVGLEWDGARLDRAIEHAAFPRLRAQEERDGFNEKPPDAVSFFRAGVAGSWRTALTPAQVQAIVDAHGEVMARFGYLRETEAVRATGDG